jgi:hypothetical protein
MAADFILFCQHGWADDNRAMMNLATDLATAETIIEAPCLNYAMTWLRMAPLIDKVEQSARGVLQEHPATPVRIVGHSMGGLLWLEVLTRNPQWWSRVHSLVLVASPVGGSDLGRMIDPLRVGVGVAADLGLNRRPMASAIATTIDTLVLAGDLDGGSDGTITLESTKVPNAQFAVLDGLSHAEMRYHPAVVGSIESFWQDQTIGEPLKVLPIIEKLQQVPGMTDAHLRGCEKATTLMTFEDGIDLKIWRNPLGIHHVFVVAPDGDCLYSGYVGWLHTEDLWQMLQSLQADYEVSALGTLFHR